MMARHRDLESALPFNGWWRNPIAAVFTVKGCSYECVTCGSSQTTCTHLTQRQRPVFRSPASLVANVEAFARLTRGPIALIGDLRQAGRGPRERGPRAAAQRAACATRSSSSCSPCLPPGFLREIDRCVPHWSIEFSPESHDQAVRDAQEGEADYTTEADGGDAARGAATALRAARRVLHDRAAGTDTRVGARHGRLLRAPVPARGRAPLLLHLADGPVHRSRQPRLRGAASASATACSRARSRSTASCWCSRPGSAS